MEATVRDFNKFREQRGRKLRFPDLATPKPAEPALEPPGFRRITAEKLHKLDEHNWFVLMCGALESHRFRLRKTRRYEASRQKMIEMYGHERWIQDERQKTKLAAQKSKAAAELIRFQTLVIEMDEGAIMEQKLAVDSDEVRDPSIASIEHYSEIWETRFKREGIDAIPIPPEVFQKA